MPIHALGQRWVLETATTAYAFGINAAGALAHCYWGCRLPRSTDYPPPPNPAVWASFDSAAHLTPEEYPAYGGMKFTEPSLKLTFADGTRDVVLCFVSATLNAENDELRIQLRDAAYPVHVTLIYRVHAAYDLIERSAEVRNAGETPITIERVWSATWHVPPGICYRLSHLSGRWADEWRLHRDQLPAGTTILESRRLNTSHHHNPFFALDQGHADEEQGAVWFGTLAWSGNWKLAAEVTDFGATQLALGINDWDFAWRLAPGTTFATPAAYAGYTDQGFGRASRMFHDFIRERIIPHGPTPHRVLYNSWEAVGFDVSVAAQSHLAELAAAMGVELFVVDDGWFHGRNHDQAGLGDWWPDAVKFPHGLGPLVERVRALGMAFGIWVEPEMVNPDSDLYRSHPDWIYRFPLREPTTGRNQLVLNLGRPEVQAYLIERLDTLLREHPISFIKWDMNRSISEPGWATAPGDQRELWVRHVQGLYHVWGTLRERHPAVFWQSCSGGGGRADLGILRYADQIWISDNTTPVARIEMQAGFSQLFPAITMEAWVTDMGPAFLPLAFRFHVSMCGSLGIGGNLLHWDEAQRTEAAQHIALYKAIRHIIQLGDCYRLRSAHEHPFSAVQYVSKDRSESVLFAFRTLIPRYAPLPPIYLRGLAPEALYAVEGFATPRSGAAWMHTGLQLSLRDLQSEVRRVRRVSGGWGCGG